MNKNKQIENDEQSGETVRKPNFLEELIERIVESAPELRGKMWLASKGKSK
jgi:hypothetical protein